MATAVIMPRQGQSVESCVISKWHKNKGDKVNVGDILFTYETAKATFDEEAKVEGILLEIFFQEGDDVPVLTNVCVIGNEGESVDEFRPGAESGAVGRESTVSSEEAGNEETGIKAGCQDVRPSGDTGAKAGGTEGREGMPSGNGIGAAGEAAPMACAGIAGGKECSMGGGDATGDGRIKISPRARNLAEKTGMDYRYATATGPNGRIIERDIVALKEKGPVFTFAARDEHIMSSAKEPVSGSGLGGRVTTGDLAAAPAGTTVSAGTTKTGETVEQDYVEVKLTNIRKVIAKSMHHSLSSMAQLTMHASFDATDILGFRKKLKESRDRLGIGNITINDIILYAVSRTILNHKDLNAHFFDDKMHVYSIVHLGIAVDTGRGLMVPTLFNANRKSLSEISAEAKALAEACQKGTINPDLLRGGTFTVTNLGTLDIEYFTPVINPPQTGILGVGTIVRRVRETNGEYEFYPAMGLSLTFDHRALDGAPAARFLKELKTNLENFTALLAK